MTRPGIPLEDAPAYLAGVFNCYAERVAARFSDEGQPYEGLVSLKQKMINGPKGARFEARWSGEVRFVKERLLDPLRWKKPRMIFVNSMSDLFHEKVPDEWINKIFAVMAEARQHTFQVLTKRPERMLAYLNTPNRGIQVDGEHETGGVYFNALPHIWMGVSVEDQKTADARIPLLAKTPAAVRWVSYEPALGLVWWPPLLADRKIGWLVCGGESGPGARPLHPEWARAARDQCAAAGVAFHMKQWGEWAPRSHGFADQGKYRWGVVARDGGFSEDTTPWNGHDDDSIGGEATMIRVGKRDAGRILDGRTWDDYPRARA